MNVQNFKRLVSLDNHTIFESGKHGYKKSHARRSSSPFEVVKMETWKELGDVKPSDDEHEPNESTIDVVDAVKLRVENSNAEEEVDSKLPLLSTGTAERDLCSSNVDDTDPLNSQEFSSLEFTKIQNETSLSTDKCDSFGSAEQFTELNSCQESVKMEDTTLEEGDNVSSTNVSASSSDDEMIPDDRQWNAVDKETLSNHFDKEGRLVYEHELRKLIFKGGVESEIRRDVWQFLFELYPCNSTSRERELLKAENILKYAALKRRWKKILCSLSSTDSKAYKLCPSWYLGCEMNLLQKELDKERYEKLEAARIADLCQKDDTPQEEIVIEKDVDPSIIAGDNPINKLCDNSSETETSSKTNNDDIPTSFTNKDMSHDRQEECTQLIDINLNSSPAVLQIECIDSVEQCVQTELADAMADFHSKTDICLPNDEVDNSAHVTDLMKHDNAVESEATFVHMSNVSRHRQKTNSFGDYTYLPDASRLQSFDNDSMVNSNPCVQLESLCDDVVEPGQEYNSIHSNEQPVIQLDVSSGLNDIYNDKPIQPEELCQTNSDLKSHPVDDEISNDQPTQLEMLCQSDDTLESRHTICNTIDNHQTQLERLDINNSESCQFVDDSSANDSKLNEPFCKTNGNAIPPQNINNCAVDSELIENNHVDSNFDIAESTNDNVIHTAHETDTTLLLIQDQSSSSLHSKADLLPNHPTDTSGSSLEENLFNNDEQLIKDANVSVDRIPPVDDHDINESLCTESTPLKDIHAVPPWIAQMLGASHQPSPIHATHEIMSTNNDCKYENTTGNLSNQIEINDFIQTVSNVSNPISAKNESIDTKDALMANDTAADESITKRHSWSTVLRKDSVDCNPHCVQNAAHSTDNAAMTKSPKCPYCTADEATGGYHDISLGNDVLDSIELQAHVYAGRQPYDNEVVKQALRIIDKDVPRTDRDHIYFNGDDNPNLLMLRDALITYSFFHPDVGYAQGMNDIVSRFLVVTDTEADAYWMLVSYMNHFKDDFLEDGMLNKISFVEQMLLKMDRELHEFLVDSGADLMFCHRWLLLSFKREFCYEDALRIFEIMSSRHLEVSSLEAAMERSKERAKELEREEGTRLLEEIDISPEYSFDIFVCVALLREYRDMIMKCDDISSIYQMVSGLPKFTDVTTILMKAENLFYKYCRKSVVDCFQIIDEHEVSDFTAKKR